VFGEFDEIRWRENYLPTFKDPSKVKRLTMRKAVEENSVNLSEMQVRKFYMNVEVNYAEIRNHQRYKK